ncbi:hypothetical protein Q8A73_006079 [Channa argus]|nr:hypothetical protein Q8A73_006079 [Channa argus]
MLREWEHETKLKCEDMGESKREMKERRGEWMGACGLLLQSERGRKGEKLLEEFHSAISEKPWEFIRKSPPNPREEFPPIPFNRATARFHAQLSKFCQNTTPGGGRGSDKERTTEKEKGM